LNAEVTVDMTKEKIDFTGTNPEDLYVTNMIEFLTMQILHPGYL